MDDTRLRECDTKCQRPNRDENCQQFWQTVVGDRLESTDEDVSYSLASYSCCRLSAGAVEPIHREIRTRRPPRHCVRGQNDNRFRPVLCPRIRPLISGPASKLVFFSPTFVVIDQRIIDHLLCRNGRTGPFRC